MLNSEQAKADNEELYNDAVQGEIRAILSQDGPQFCGQVATKADKDVKETRWHLQELVAKGEIDYSWITGS